MSDFDETLQLIRETAANDPFELTDAVLPAIAGKAALISPADAAASSLQSFEIPGCKHPLWKEHTPNGWLLLAEPGSSILTRAALACCSGNNPLPTHQWVARLAEFAAAAQCMSAMAALAQRIQVECTSLPVVGQLWETPGVCRGAWQVQIEEVTDDAVRYSWVEQGGRVSDSRPRHDFTEQFVVSPIIRFIDQRHLAIATQMPDGTTLLPDDPHPQPDGIPLKEKVLAGWDAELKIFELTGARGYKIPSDPNLRENLRGKIKTAIAATA